MAWFFRTSAHGIHVVYGQKAEDSCGIACVLMVNFKLKKWQWAAAAATAPLGVVNTVVSTAGAFDAAVKSEEAVYAAYSKVSGHPYTGTTYTGAIFLARVLNELGIGHWKAKCYRANKLADEILRQAFMGPPFIVLVHWRTGGGHFVTCDDVVHEKAEISADLCDPWDAAVRTVPLHKGQMIVYQATDQPGWDLGQTHKKYGAASTGDVDGWIIYRTGG